MRKTEKVSPGRNSPTPPGGLTCSRHAPRPHRLGLHNLSSTQTLPTQTANAYPASGLIPKDATSTAPVPSCLPFRPTVSFHQLPPYLITGLSALSFMPLCLVPVFSLLASGLELAQERVLSLRPPGSVSGGGRFSF